MKEIKEISRAKEIYPTATKVKLEAGALLVDVRELEEAQEVTYDVANYLHIPLGELEKRFIEIPKDREIIFACRSGARSLRATYFLMNSGHESVFNLKGGLLKWINKGFPAKGNVEALLAEASCDCSKPDCC